MIFETSELQRTVSKIKETHIELLHPHCIQQYSQKFVSVLLCEIKVLIIFPSYRVEKYSKT
jgi:hypothetical protein